MPKKKKSGLRGNSSGSRKELLERIESLEKEVHTLKSNASNKRKTN